MKNLTNQRALDLLKLYHIPVLDYSIVNNSKQVSKNERPFMLKIDSPTLIHKSERKDGVVRVYHPEHMEKHFTNMRKHGQVIKQPFVEGHEFIIQLIRPPKGKASLIVGCSGVSTDIHNDFSLRICPIKPSSAKKMITELQTINYFSKFNGKNTRFDILEDTLIKIGNLTKKESIKSLEIDPFILNHKAGRVVDAKILLDK